MEIVLPNTSGLSQAATALRAGNVVAYPTESVYGLGVDPLDEQALEALYRVKERDPDNPVLIIISKEEQLTCLVDHITPEARKAMNTFWPGPQSLLFPAKASLSELLLGNQEKVCIRHTNHPIAGALCRFFDGPIVSTSANLYSKNPAQSPEEIQLPGVAICIDGGVANNTPSTVYDPDSGTVLREGAISRVELVNALS